MGLFDFLKKKKKDEPTPQEETPGVTELGFDPSEIDPPETRYTQEYRDFLASREADERREAPEEALEEAAADERDMEDGE